MDFDSANKLMKELVSTEFPSLKGKVKLVLADKETVKGMGISGKKKFAINIHPSLLSNKEKARELILLGLALAEIKSFGIKFSDFEEKARLGHAIGDIRAWSIAKKHGWKYKQNYKKSVKSAFKTLESLYKFGPVERQLKE